MLFDESFIDRVKASPIEGANDACSAVLDRLGGTVDWEDRDYGDLMEVYALLEGLTAAGLLVLSVMPPILIESYEADRGELYKYVKAVREDLISQMAMSHLDAMKARYIHAFSNSFSYEFSAGDLEKIQITINELRQLIADSVLLESGHRQRLLKRLEKLQAEMHKKVSDLDRFWGFVGDAGVVLGKLGMDAKPIVDRITEIVRIVWRTQARAEELPSGSPVPMLGEMQEEQA